MDTLSRLAQLLGKVEWHDTCLIVPRSHKDYQVRTAVAACDESGVVRVWVPNVHHLQGWQDFLVASALMEQLNFIRVLFDAPTRTFSVGFEMPAIPANDAVTVSLINQLPSIVVDLVLAAFEEYKEKLEIENARRRLERLID